MSPDTIWLKTAQHKAAKNIRQQPETEPNNQSGKQHINHFKSRLSNASVKSKDLLPGTSTPNHHIHTNRSK
jgi:hypothetical protein